MRTTIRRTAMLAVAALLLAAGRAPAADGGGAPLRLVQSGDDDGGMLRRREEPAAPETAPAPPSGEEPAADEAGEAQQGSAPVTPALPTAEEQTYEPEMDAQAAPAELEPDGFRDDPSYAEDEYSVEDQIEIYGGKTAVDAPRPLMELGYPMYSAGAIGAGHNLIGRKNLVRPQFLLFGDWRTAVGRNTDDGGEDFSRAATRLNLNANLNITGTERLFALFRPLEDDDGNFTRHVFDRTDANGQELDDVSEVETSAEPVTLFFEGDMGRIWGGLSDEYNDLELPFSVGRIPLFVQNGIWLDDAFDGFAFALPALNSPALDISNMDIAFYAGFNEINTNAIPNSVRDASLFAVAAFIERRPAYWELDYGYVQDDGDDGVDSSYHNVSVAWSRRFGAWLSHSTRVIGNFGQDEDGAGNNTADGGLLLLENSLITSKPYTLVPYLNVFYGDGTPQALAQTAGQALQNTGINFEEDAITGFPALDDTGRNAYGGALGIEYLFNLNRQIVVEVAGLSRHGEDSDRDDEFAVGVRFQQPFAQQWIFRADAVVGEKVPGGSGTVAEDFSSVRAELRVKF
ncbi:MAG: hypothetical protein U5K43_11010 [Halofilum sp. (in: g-proteobacteria)]|nr:hypothetical protein [Halofilum sp. (in: g-proteobacteria)]